MDVYSKELKKDIKLKAELFHSHLDRVLPDLQNYQVVSEMFVLCENEEDFDKYFDCSEEINHAYITRVLK